MNERIKELRKVLDFTQQEFADRIGMKRNTVANYEINRNEPSNSVISLICREFNVNENWLRTGVGEMFEPKATDALDTLASEYGMSQSDRILIEKFLSLKPEHRQAVMQYAMDVVAAFNALEVSSTEQAEPEPQTTVVEAEAAYIKSRLDAAQKAEQFALNSTGEDTEDSKIS